MEEIELVIKLPRDTFKKTIFYREFRDLNDCITTIKALEKAKPLPDVLDEIKSEINNTFYVDSLIFGELLDFRNGKIDANDVIEKFNRVAIFEILKILDEYKADKGENNDR